METCGSPQGRRSVTFAALLVVLISAGGFHPRSVCAQAACNGLTPPPIPSTDPNYTTGFSRDSEIPYFIDVSASPGEQAQIEAGFAYWQEELLKAGKNFTFTRTDDQIFGRLHGIDVVIGPTFPGDPANFKVTRTDPDTHELKSARITLDLRGGPAAGLLYFDPERPGYGPHGAAAGAITKAVMHEVGHSLGLHHFGGRACSDQHAGASVMNGMCGINDAGATINGVKRPPALANRPAACDVAAVAVQSSRDGTIARRD